MYRKSFSTPLFASLFFLASCSQGNNPVTGPSAPAVNVAVTSPVVAVVEPSPVVAEPPSPPVAADPPPAVVTPALCTDRDLTFYYEPRNSPSVYNNCATGVTLTLYVNELTDQPKTTYSTMTVTIPGKTRGYFSVTKPDCADAQYDWQYVTGLLIPWTYGHSNPHNAGGPDNVWRATADCRPQGPPPTVTCVVTEVPEGLWEDVSAESVASTFTVCEKRQRRRIVNSCTGAFVRYEFQTVPCQVAG